MKRQAGFTLIELVMVIVILGILSAFALPRFADLGADARLASITAAQGAVKSASAISHADALVSNQTGATGSITLEGQTVGLVFGYPAAGGSNASPAGIAIAAQLDPDFTFTSTTASPPVTTVTISGTASGSCQFTYTEAANATTPAVIGDVTGGC